MTLLPFIFTVFILLTTSHIQLVPRSDIATFLGVRT